MNFDYKIYHFITIIYHFRSQIDTLILNGTRSFRIFYWVANTRVNFDIIFTCACHDYDKFFVMLGKRLTFLLMLNINFIKQTHFRHQIDTFNFLLVNVFLGNLQRKIV